MTTTLATALAAFIREHEYCGELDTELEDKPDLDVRAARGSSVTWTVIDQGARLSVAGRLGIR